MPFITHNKKRILFIHIPKTGGTSVGSWLKTIAPMHFESPRMPSGFLVTPQHLTNSDFNSLFHKNFFNFRFAIVRDPYARMESEYRFRTKIAKSLSQPELPTFSIWLEVELEAFARTQTHLDNHLRPQVDFIGSGVNVYKFEDGMALILAAIAKDSGLPTPEKVAHARKATRMDIEWDLQDRLKVNRVYADDFARFGYPMINN